MWPEKIRKITLPLLAITILLGLWEGSVHYFSIETWLLPAPSHILYEFKLSYKDFVPHLLATFNLTVLGFLVGGVVGLGVAILLHFSKLMHETFYPFLILSQNIPIIVLAPLLVIWFGFGYAPKLIVITLACFFPIAISTLTGLTQTRKDYLLYMAMMHATPRQLFIKVELPFALPTIFSGMKIAATYSVMAGVVSEWLGAQKGIGVYMTLAASSYKTTRVFMAIIVTMLLSILFFWLVSLLEKGVLKRIILK